MFSSVGTNEKNYFPVANAEKLFSLRLRFWERIKRKVDEVREKKLGKNIFPRLACCSRVGVGLLAKFVARLVIYDYVKSQEWDRFTAVFMA